MPDLTLSSNTTFNQVFSTFESHSSRMKGRKSDLRIDETGTNLHTKNPSKLSGITRKAYANRVAKKEAAVRAVRNALHKEFTKAGFDEGTADALLQSLRSVKMISRDHHVTIKDLHTIKNAELDQETTIAALEGKLTRAGLPEGSGGKLLQELRESGRINGDKITVGDLEVINQTVTEKIDSRTVETRMTALEKRLNREQMEEGSGAEVLAKLVQDLRGSGRITGDKITVRDVEVITQAVTETIKEVRNKRDMDPELLFSYDKAMKRDDNGYSDAHNGIYKKTVTTNGFAEFHRMELGDRHQDIPINSEKLHISVDPRDVKRAYEVIAPILGDEDSPIGRWKVVDIDDATKTVKKFDTWESETDPIRQGEMKLMHQKASRLSDGDQFTLYTLPGQDPKEVREVMWKIERALERAGIRPTTLPESDEPLPSMAYVTFRLGSRPGRPGDREYDGEFEVANEAGKEALRNGTRKVEIYVDPFAPGYDGIKATFADHPFYKALLSN